MSLARFKRLLLTLIALATLTVFSACREEERPDAGENGHAVASNTPASQVADILPSPTPTVTNTPRPTSTPLPSATPTITPTPTATAPPILLNGNPLASAIHDAAPQAGAPCGVVDLLDFPLDPPDALNISRGGQDFNAFRNRYDGYHAGEDWWGPGGRAAVLASLSIVLVTGKLHLPILLAGASTRGLSSYATSTPTERSSTPFMDTSIRPASN